MSSEQGPRAVGMERPRLTLEADTRIRGALLTEKRPSHERDPRQRHQRFQGGD